MKNFTDISTSGNERALRRGTRVPNGDVNLAWIKSPKLTPENNIVILDTSRTVKENQISYPKQTHLMFANSLGILESEDGNQVISDEYPCVADVFSQDEDFLLVPGNEYTDDDPLPFVHISRFFHADFAGITMGTELQSYTSDSIQVVDTLGRNFTNTNGEPKYRIKLTPAYNIETSATVDSSTGIYRVWVFLPSDTNEEIFLKYNKVEISAAGSLVEQIVDHKEILNPQPYFKYVPEESDVVDPANRNKNIYTTKPISKKAKSAGRVQKDVEGYRVYVPKKALPDPRLHQLTRWRVKCDFVQDYQVRSSKVDETTLEHVNVGVITTNQSDGSTAAYAFLNLENSNYNKANIRFVNPFASVSDKQKAAYWQVNMDTISDRELTSYDILLLASDNPYFDWSSTLPRINYFVNVVGGTVLVDSNSTNILNNAGFTFSDLFNSQNGGSIVSNLAGSKPVRATTVTASDDDNTILLGNTNLGGWDIADTDSTFDSISLHSNSVYGEYIQYIDSYPSDYSEILSGTDTDGSAQTLMVSKTSIGDSGSRRGKVYVSTLGFTHAVNALVSTTGSLVYSNYDRDNVINTSNYESYINSSYVATASKLFYNIILHSTKGKYTNVDIDEQYSSVWSVVSDWGSTWVIDGSVLTEYERAINDFVFLPKNPTGDTDSVWQRRLSSRTLKQIVDSKLTEESAIRVRNATRIYSIEVTNDSIGIPTVLSDSSIPSVWSIAYTPAFNIPIDFGAHVVRSELIQGEYDAGQYVYKSYPSRNYDLGAQFTFSTSSDSFIDQTTTWTATGTAQKTTKYIDTSTVSEPVTTTTTSTITRDETLLWTTHGGGDITTMTGNAWADAPRPDGMTTWQEKNYASTAFGTGLASWPFWGLTGRYSTDENARGEVVSFIQNAINLFELKGYITTPRLSEDGVFGPATAGGVRALQTQQGAQYVDGIVGAETWSIIGFGIKRYEKFRNDLIAGSGTADLKSKTGYKRFYSWAVDRCDFLNISNGDASKTFSKRSWVRNGPSVVWDLFTVVYDTEHDIHAVTVIPFVEGDEDTCMVRSVHVERNVNGLVGWDADNSLYKSLPHRPKDGQELYLPIGPHRGKQIIIGMGQDRSSGFGSARLFGVRDIRAHAKTKKTITDTKTIDGEETFYPGKIETEVVTFTQTGTVTVNANNQSVVNISAPYTADLDTSDEDIEYIHYNQIQYTDFTSSNANVSVDFDVAANDATSATMVFTTNYSINNTSTNVTYGDRLPGTGLFTYYSKTPSDYQSTVPESGWISKDEGVKLFCDSSGRPVGIPDIPSQVDPSTDLDTAILALRSYGTDDTVRYGFYDNSTKEFITSGSSGSQILTYSDYLERGSNNVYIAAISTYEVSENKDLPSTEDAPAVPRLWAMPVYGICYNAKSRIGIEPLPKNLGSMDLWPIPIRVGSFDKNIPIASRNDESITHWTRAYEGTTLHAFYGIPEANNAAWSLLYGRPNTDIKDEIPDILSDTVIRVRQAPFLMVSEPYSSPSKANPVRPVFSVYTRADVNSAWEALQWSDIADYNASNGTIYLKTALASSDANLVKVSYTSTRKVYDFKQYSGSNRINLNPYLLKDESTLNKPIYVYIIPEYVYDADNNLITTSVSSSTVRWTTDPGIFNSLDSAMYNPLAIKLGIIYITNSADIKNLSLLDTRLRGGGVSEYIDDNEIKNELSYTENYWDINYGSGEAYQSGGFVIIRLPAELKTRFDDDDSIITEVIERNIPAGVAYKIEDLNGNSWR
jgi:hypothetical protein